jgi:uncharacterized protein YndB with AHSA1/START domain
MTSTNGPTDTATDRELVIQRIFDAPREVVFKAWTEAEHVARWFGPRDFTAPHCEIDFRVGGRYRICMLSPEGEEHWVEGEYREIVEPERIVFTWNREYPDGEVWSRTVATVTFDEHDGNRTAFTLRQSMFETVPYRDEHGFGWGQSLDRLDQYVASLNN